MTQSAGDAGARGGYGLLVLLTLMNVINFVDRQLLASFSNFIVPDLGLTNTEFGLLTGLVFIVFYAVAGFFMGALADMVNRPRLIAIAMFAWSALTAASGLAKNFVSLAIPRVFIGIGESALTPTSMSLLADRFPPERRGFASGFYYMGVPVGVGVSLLIAGFLGPAIGWRNCFFLLGAIGVLFSLVVLQVKETRPPAAHGVERPKFGELLKVFVAALKASPPLQLTIAAGVAIHFLLGAATFDQLWLVRERGFEKAEIAIITGLISVFAGVAGNLFGGIACDRFVAATGQSRPMFMVWVLLALLPINLTYRLIDPQNAIFWLCLVVGSFQLGVFYGPTFSAVQELCPPQVRSTVVAFYIMSLNVVGLGIGITGSGIMVDVLTAQGNTHPYSWTLFTFTALSALSIPCYFAAAKLSGRRPALAG
ncbi:MAG: MFS transporter [Phenylobacterium sp.]|uniref:spinster family MFS transporter n=1 Tax=Phenylobacterium sp. TaxID=1871053 RepID=UPI001A5BE9DA|nr:MFS transporter [Phenylobacterium sp.]MBL8770222.1 MFS transporter [Phenylobacterium sp.]